MSTILGINAYHADSSACLIKNNNLIFAVEEEKINREKHWAGFPEKSINLGLKLNNIDGNDISDIAVNFNPYSNLYQKSTYFILNYLFGIKKKEIFTRTKTRLNFKRNLSFANKGNFKFHYVDHHISHIASAYYASGFDKAIGLSIDGFGDFTSLAIAECIGKEIKIKKKIHFPHSLGLFYEAVTQFLGFKSYGDEYKVMGLSSYGKPIYFEKILDNLFINDELFKLNLSFFNHTRSDYEYDYRSNVEKKTIFSNKINILFLEEVKKNNNNFKEDFAASAQKVFEYFLTKIILFIKKNFENENLVYAGGCALNSKANRIIYEKEYFKNIFIPYAPGDGGGSIGAAYFIHQQKYKKKLINIKSPFIGPKYTSEKIHDCVKKLENKYNFEHYSIKNYKFYTSVAKILREKKVIGWFHENIEFGARALGNRSIIADPSNPNVKDLINLKIKRRESFRPFAPSIILDEKNKWFNNNIENPYMSYVEKIKIEKKNIVPGVVHIDNTCRLQTVTEHSNKNYFHLLNSFNNLTGIPILLNTSFNENEPIVNDPEEAIDCFLRTDMDVLVLENFIIYK